MRAKLSILHLQTTTGSFRNLDAAVSRLKTSEERKGYSSLRNWTLCCFTLKPLQQESVHVVREQQQQQRTDDQQLIQTKLDRVCCQARWEIRRNQPSTSEDETAVLSAMTTSVLRQTLKWFNMCIRHPSWVVYMNRNRKSAHLCESLLKRRTWPR